MWKYSTCLNNGSIGTGSIKQNEVHTLSLFVSDDVDALCDDRTINAILTLTCYPGTSNQHQIPLPHHNQLLNKETNTYSTSEPTVPSAQHLNRHFMRIIWLNVNIIRLNHIWDRMWIFAG